MKPEFADIADPVAGFGFGTLSYGYPMKAMWAGTIYTTGKMPEQIGWFHPKHIDIRMPVVAGGTHSPRLPYRIHPAGFLVNTALYASVWVALLGAPLALLGVWRKRRRGLCPRCAYDLAGVASERCPECGRVIRREA